MIRRGTGSQSMVMPPISVCLSLHFPSKVFKDQVCLVPYLSPSPLVLLSLQEIQQYLKQCGVLPVGLHHIASAGHQLPQGP